MQVIVIFPVVLLNIEIASPSANVASGMVIEPPEPTCTYLPISAVANVYELVLVPTAGKFKYPILEVMVGNVIVVASVPAKVSELLAVKVLPSAIVRVAFVAGAVRATLFIDVAVATPNTGVTNVGLVDNTTAVVPVDDVTPVPPLATGSVPVTPVVSGKPVKLVAVPEVGVPNAPPLVTKAPDEPTATPNAVATFVPNPLTPVDIGKPVQEVNVPELGVPNTGVVSVGDVSVLLVNVSVVA